MTQTKITNLVEPQLMADGIKARLGDAIKFTPVAHVQELTGAGSTVTLPSFQYVGDAVEVLEGQPIPVELLTQTSVDVKVKKYGKAVELTDESVRNAYGDVVQNAEDQMVQAIVNGVEKEVVEQLADATLVHDATATGKVNGDVFLDAMNLFGENQDEEVFLYVNPSQLSNIRKDAGYENGKLYEATVVPTNRIANGEAFIIKRDALGLLFKSQPALESDRNILTKSTVISADQHFVAYLRDASRVVKVKITA